MATSLEALEQFVVDNDALLELEERIGRFNIFDSLGIARAEIRHSNFLAWLLDPAESHGQGGLFLKAVLMDLLKQSPPELRPLSPVELDGEDLRGVEVRREWRHIDLLITCKQPAFVIAIENKVDSGEHSNQLQRYEDVVEEHFPDRSKQLFVFLTTDGDDASDADWVPYSYADIHRVLTRVRRTNATAIGDDVLAFLDHYLNLIGSRFMDDPKIDELCRRIYKNHRQAIDVIFEKVGVSSSQRVSAMREVVESDGTWHIFNQTDVRIDMIPKSWVDVIPPICARPKQDAKYWIRWYVIAGPKKGRILIEIGPATDQEVRSKVIETLCDASHHFDLKHAKKVGKNRTRLLSKVFATWTDDEDADIAAIHERLPKALAKAITPLAGVPDALRPIMEQWQAEHPQDHDAASRQSSSLRA